MVEKFWVWRNYGLLTDYLRTTGDGQTDVEFESFKEKEWNFEIFLEFLGYWAFKQKLYNSLYGLLGLFEL